jgi:MFS transporter, CP family, cyanate transporter
VSRTQSPSAVSSHGQVRLERTLLVIGVAALGFNLRTAITSLPPVFPELQSSLHLSAATISVLAATPVICFGVVSGFAAALARRAGEERVLLGALVLLVIGLVARGAAPAALLFPGTIAASAAIAIMNVLLSSLIKRRWPERAGFLIGLYITALSAGAIVASLVSVPLWQSSGGSLALTLGWLAAPAALAALLWLPQARSGSRSGSRSARPGAGSAASPVPADARPARPARVPVHRHAITWYVTLFMGMQSLLYYATLSWLPTMLRDRGESAAGAGDLLALMGVGNLAVSLLVPVAAQRMRSQVVLVVPTVAAIGGGLAALLYAPLGGAAAWALILGAGQNAALALAIFFTAARAPHAAAAASLSALSQAVGYLLASVGPLEVGLLHSATGSWTAPVMVLFALSVVLLAAGIMAARPRLLPAASADSLEKGAPDMGERDMSQRNKRAPGKRAPAMSAPAMGQRDKGDPDMGEPEVSSRESREIGRGEMGA